MPLSVSVAPNVPGYEPAQCYITAGEPEKLVEEMMNNLIVISDAAYDCLLPSYEYVLDELKARENTWEEGTKEAVEEEDEEGEEGRNNPYKTLIRQLLGWLRQLPVIGFNSGRYDLNVIKQFLIPYLLKNGENQFVIKRQNSFMCLSTN